MDKDYFNFLGQNIGEEKKEAPQKTQAMANIAIRVDADCLLLCDGEYLDVQLEAGKITKIQLPIGQHLLEFLYTEDPDIKVEKDDADFPESGKSYFVNIKGLKAAVDSAMTEVKAKEEETKHLAEEKKHHDVDDHELVRMGNENYAQKRYSSAIELYSKAIELSNNAEAKFMLGLCRFNGEGFSGSDEEVIRLWKESSEDGYLQAQYRLGIYYKNEEDDEEEAIKWLTMAADNGYEPAQSLLGTIYSQYESEVNDYSLALKWYKASADQGNKESKIHYEGWNCLYRHDYEKAYSLFEQAGFEEDVRSLKLLVFECEEDEIAMKWFVKIGDQEFIQDKKDDIERKKLSKYWPATPSWDYYFPEDTSNEVARPHHTLVYNPNTGEFEEQ